MLFVVFPERGLHPMCPPSLVPYPDASKETQVGWFVELRAWKGQPFGHRPQARAAGRVSAKPLAASDPRPPLAHTAPQAQESWLNCIRTGQTRAPSSRCSCIANAAGDASLCAGGWKAKGVIMTFDSLFGAERAFLYLPASVRGASGVFG